MISHRTLAALLLLLFVAATLAIAQEAAPVEQPAPTDAAAAPAAASPGPAGRVFAAGETIAIVGDQHVLVGDMLGEINQMLAPYEGQASEEEIEEQRQKLLRQMLPNVVENKILYLEFLRQVPPERIKDIKKKMDEEFEAEKLESAMERAQVGSAMELELMLRKYGSSLEKQRRTYMEQKLGRAMLARNVNYQPEISHEEMLEYYRDHASDFDISAKAKWEQLSVLFANHPSKEEAWAKLAEMGNEVLRGAQFAAVAKKHSESSSAADGGQYDWVTRGSLASKKLDDAVFTLPLAQLSPMLEDERGFHIVRVLDRQDASRVDFVTAQKDIKETLRKQKIQKQVVDCLAKLKGKTRVWTAFDDEAATSTQQAKDTKRSAPALR
jgi:parvulin-like peptidyl-prolyl isomerase